MALGSPPSLLTSSPAPPKGSVASPSMARAVSFGLSPVLMNQESPPLPITPDYGGPSVCYADGILNSRFGRHVTVTFNDEKFEVIDFQIIWSSSPDSLKYDSYFSLPELIEFPTEVPGQNAYAYFYPLSNQFYQASQEVESRKVDGNRTCITGVSAGGYTTLATLAFRETFRAGASLYGVVPPDQARKIYAALKQKGLPVALVEYEGEQHGFRKKGQLVPAGCNNSISFAAPNFISLVRDCASVCSTDL
ncbi:hypothetical protein NL676_025001 [Syzygium grande]|nr:hypothetical protein NL676_025001 [Syzygium grande]